MRSGPRDRKRRPHSAARRFLRVLILMSLPALASGAEEQAAGTGAHPPIATIRIERSDVFEVRESDRYFPYKLANRLHVETREHVIRRELLFDVGSPADPDVLYESERNLRRLGFLHDNSRILTVSRPDGRVDVVVRVRDTWTTRPEISYEREGDRSTGRVSFVEQNVAGFGKVAGISFRRELDRDSGGLMYQDPRLLGTWWTLDAEYFNRSDGILYSLATGRPFYSLLTERAGGVAGGHFSQVTELQLDGEDAPGFRQRQTRGLIDLAHAFDRGYDRVRRLDWRLRVEDDAFAIEPGEPPLDPRPPLGGAGYAALPDDRRFRILELEYRHLDVDYVKAAFLDRFDRTEDLNLGEDWSVSLGVSPDFLGDARDRLFFGGRYERWHRLGEIAYLRTGARLSGRTETGRGRNVLGGLDVSWYHLGWPRQTLVAHAGFAFGHAMDGDGQILLGADTGLRGFDNRRFDGNKRVLLNVEDRVYLLFDWARLLSIGVVAFADAGYVWRAGRGVDPGDLLADVGVGLRFDLTRGRSGTVIRLDWAYPLSRLGQEENPGGVLSFSTGQAF
ncbi:MAG: BamA/TamA family outer membrane protein [Candidatus Polarisedimenticolia bacterium]